MSDYNRDATCDRCLALGVLFPVGSSLLCQDCFDDSDRSGFDRSGFDRSGFDRSGFDRSGFDRNSKWIEQHRGSFHGEWVALADGGLVDHDRSRMAMHLRLKVVGKPRGVLFVMLG